MMQFHPVRPEQARAMLASMACVPKWDTSDGLCSIEEIIGNGRAYVAEDSGPLMLFVIERVQRAHGAELLIRVARQLSSRGDLIETVVPEIEREFGVGCDFSTVVTRRSGLVAKLEKAGYAESGKIMRKRLQ